LSKDNCLNMLHPTWAVIDLGTNTTKCSIAGLSGDTLYLQEEYIEYNRLGEGLTQSGNLSATAMQRTLEVIRKLLVMIRLHHVEDVLVVGTMALRTAQNAGDFIGLVRRESGLNIDILDAQSEARYSQRAAMSMQEISEAKTLVFDIGGGSTELIGCKADGSLYRESALLGAVTLTEGFGAHDRIPEQDLRKMADHAQMLLNQHLPVPDVDLAVGLGGSVITLRDLLDKSDSDPAIDLAEVEAMITRLSDLPLARRRCISSLTPQRADIIVAGLVIIHTIIKLQSLTRFRVCPWGMRHGLLLARTGAKTMSGEHI